MEGLVRLTHQPQKLEQHLRQAGNIPGNLHTGASEGVPTPGVSDPREACRAHSYPPLSSWPSWGVRVRAGCWKDLHSLLLTARGKAAVRPRRTDPDWKRLLTPPLRGREGGAGRLPKASSPRCGLQKGYNLWSAMRDAAGLCGVRVADPPKGLL